ncbi:MAG: aspartate aminotransferase family protein [Parvularculaceae bacterium]|nr:aspartate aminotransferase family protein [Parvularculaceae bacterium]
MGQTRNSLSLLERHKAVMPAWLALYYKEPISLVSGEGRRVRDANDVEYLDFFAGILTNMIGYNVPEIVEEIRDQAGRILHTSTLYLIESQVELAEEIAALSGIPDARVFFTSSGSEANDAALMLATAYRRSNQVLAMRYSYHGRTMSTVPVTGHSTWSPSSLSPFMVNYIHGSYPYRSPFGHLSGAAYIDACVGDLKEILDVATAGDVACLIAEPITGVGGFGTPPDGLFGAFQKVLKEKGILFISDEVQTGWGRTGEHFWGYQAHGVTPDIITFAKGLGNGLAIGGVIARAEIMDCFKVNSLSTFGGNPLSTRGALATLRYLKKHDLQRNALERGRELRAGLEKIAAASKTIGEVRGKGLMQGLEFVEPGSKTPNSAVSLALLEETRARGLLIGRGGLFGNVNRIAPPLTITADEVREGLDIIEASIASIE